MRKHRSSFGSLGEPYHAGRLYVGLNVNNKRTGKVIRKVSLADVERMVKEVAVKGTGGLTLINAEGRYVGKHGKKFPVEASKVFTVIASGKVSCPRFKSRIHAIASKLARIGEQDSVLAEVQC